MSILYWLSSVLALVPAQQTGAERLRVPDGFVVEQVAGEPNLRFPMFADFDERGRLFVAESSGLDLYAEITAGTRNCRVRLLEDRDDDGKFETSLVFADRLVFPMGLAWHEGKLYVADPPDLIALEDTDGDGHADRRTVILTGFGHTDNGSLHGLLFGRDGLLYMTMGSPDGYRLKRADGTWLEGRSGALIRCRPDGSEPEVLCRGFANLVEIAFTPRGDVLGTDNWFQKPSGGIRDALVHLIEGGLYPYEPDVGTPYPVTGEPLPAASLFPAVALSGLVSYRGPSFPAEMRGNLFSAQHNARSVGRHVLLADGSTFRTRDMDFVSTDDPDFHPSDVLEAADGSLLVLDTGSWYVQHCPTGRIRKVQAPGGIYRVRAIGARPVHDPWGRKLDTKTAPSEELVKWLSDPRPVVCDRARRALAARGSDAVAALASVLDRAGETRVKQEAIWALSAFAHDSASAALRRALADTSPDIVIAAARALALRGDRQCASSLGRLLDAPDAAVRLAAAEALARCGDTNSMPQVWQALANQPDRFLEHALVHAAHRLADVRSMQAALSHSHPRVQKAALILLDQPPRPRGELDYRSVIERMGAGDAELRAAAVRILERHAEWAEPARDVLGAWLEKSPLSSEELAGLRSLVLAFQRHRPVQKLIARAIRGPRKAPPEQRVVLLEALARSALAEIPAEWIAAFEQAIVESEPAVRLEALRTAAVLQVPQLDERLAGLADDPAEPADVRQAALRAIVFRRPTLSVPAFEFLLGQLNDTEAPLARLAAAEVLGRCQLNDDQLSRFLRILRGDLLILPATVLPVLSKSASDATARDVLDYLEHAVATGWRPSEEELARSLQTLPADAQSQSGSIRDLWRRASEGQVDRLAKYEPLLAGGDAEHGRSVFLSKAVACSTCHRIGRDGGSVGPDLTKVGAIRSGRDLLESIILPSSTIAQGYEPYVVVTTDGRLASGVIARQGDDAIVLRDSSGGEVRLPRGQILELKRLTTSIMPEGLERPLADEELRDLVAYLKSLK